MLIIKHHRHVQHSIGSTSLPPKNPWFAFKVYCYLKILEQLKEKDSFAKVELFLAICGILRHYTTKAIEY